MIKTVFLPVAPEVAWGYLTKAEKLALWFHAPKEDLEAGKPYILLGTESGDKLCWGTVKKMNPFTRLVYSFSVKPAPDFVSEVDWTLNEVVGGTRITMRHSGFDQLGADGFGLIQAMDSGWDRHFAQMREIK